MASDFFTFYPVLFALRGDLIFRRVRQTEGAIRAAMPTILILGDSANRNVAEKLRPRLAFISDGVAKKNETKIQRELAVRIEYAFCGGEASDFVKSHPVFSVAFGGI